MGTLHDQPVRDSRKVTIDDCENVMNLARELSARYQRLTIAEVIEVVRVAEYKRRTDIMVNDRDRWDEQISDIGHLLEKFYWAKQDPC